MTQKIDDFPAYWQGRYERRGKRGAGHVADKDGSLWEEQRQYVHGVLEAIIRRVPATSVLDYGCGPQRFAAAFVDAGLEYCGVDIVPSLLDTAQYPMAVIRPGGVLPFATDAFDLVFTCTVLQHVPDHTIRSLAAEFYRVSPLRLFYENTTPGRPRQSDSGHIVFRTPDEYEKLFGVQQILSHECGGEQHTWFGTESVAEAFYAVLG